MGPSKAVMVTVGYDGEVHVVLHYNEYTPCIFNMAEFPHDSHICRIFIIAIDSMVSSLLLTLDIIRSQQLLRLCSLMSVLSGHSSYYFLVT